MEQQTWASYSNPFSRFDTVDVAYFCRRFGVALVDDTSIVLKDGTVLFYMGYISRNEAATLQH